MLRDDGVTYHQYLSEVTCLLFLKMMKETGQEARLKIWKAKDKQKGSPEEEQASTRWDLGSRVGNLIVTSWSEIRQGKRHTRPC